MEDDELILDTVWLTEDWLTDVLLFEVCCWDELFNEDVLDLDLSLNELLIEDSGVVTGFLLKLVLELEGIEF